MHGVILVNPGDLVWIEGHEMPSVFLGWVSDAFVDDPDEECYGVAYLLVNGEIRKEHNDWWMPWNPQKIK